MLDIQRQAGSGGRVAHYLKGRIDGQASEPLYTQIVKAEGTGLKALALSLAGVDFVSSAGIRTVLKLTRSWKDLGATFAVAAMLPGVAKIFEIAAAQYASRHRFAGDRREAHRQSLDQFVAPAIDLFAAGSCADEVGDVRDQPFDLG